MRAARALLFDVWGGVEASIETGNRVSTRELSLIHHAKSEVHEAGVEACQFAYRAASGASLRAGVMQRTFRDMMTAVNHFTINPNIVGAAGREIGGTEARGINQRTPAFRMVGCLTHPNSRSGQAPDRRWARFNHSQCRNIRFTDQRP